MCNSMSVIKGNADTDSGTELFFNQSFDAVCLILFASIKQHWLGAMFKKLK